MVQGQSIATVTGASALPVQPAAEQQEVETEMGPAVTIMKPILRFLQLLCENHNQDLQVSEVPGKPPGPAGSVLPLDNLPRQGTHLVCDFFFFFKSKCFY